MFAAVDDSDAEDEEPEMELEKLDVEVIDVSVPIEELIVEIELLDIGVDKLDVEVEEVDVEVERLAVEIGGPGLVLLLPLDVDTPDVLDGSPVTLELLEIDSLDAGELVTLLDPELLWLVGLLLEPVKLDDEVVLSEVEPEEI